jgi:integrase
LFNLIFRENRQNRVDLGDFDPRPLEAEEVTALAQHLSGRGLHAYALLIKFTAATGLRAAEIQGLEIGHLDLDPDHPSVTVHRPKSKVRTGPGRREWVAGTSKSRKSRREVPLDVWLVSELQDYLDGHPRKEDRSAPLFPARRRLRKEERPEDGYNWGAPVDMHSFYATYMKSALQAVGLPATLSAKRSATGEAQRGVRFHDLRHTFAILSLREGMPIWELSQILGHSSITITQNIYLKNPNGNGGYHRKSSSLPAM